MQSQLSTSQEWITLLLSRYLCSCNPPVTAATFYHLVKLIFGSWSIPIIQLERCPVGLQRTQRTYARGVVFRADNTLEEWLPQSFSIIGLEGTLSPSIGNLSLLHTLNLSYSIWQKEFHPSLDSLKYYWDIAWPHLYLAMGFYSKKALSNCTHLKWIQIPYNNLLRGAIQT